MRMLITSTIAVTSLLLAGAGALAADANVHKTAKKPVAHVHAVVHSAARQAYPRYAGAPYGFRAPYGSYYAPYNVGPFGGWSFNGKVPRTAARGGRGSPSFDSGPLIDESTRSPAFAGPTAGDMAIQAIVDSAGSASAAAAQAISDAQQIINNSQ